MLLFRQQCIILPVLNVPLFPCTRARQVSIFPPFHISQCAHSWECARFHDIVMYRFYQPLPAVIQTERYPGLLFYSIPEHACKCSNTASIMQLRCHATTTFPNGLSHKKRSASNRLDIHNDWLLFYLTCNLIRKRRQKFLSTFRKHGVRGVCTKPIKERIAFRCFFSWCTLLEIYRHILINLWVTLCKLDGMFCSVAVVV